MRNRFLSFLIFTALGGYFYHLRHTVPTNGESTAVTPLTQWFAPAAPPVWTAPVNPQYPSVWTTMDGQKFSNVKVMVMEADAVTIMHSDGVAVVNLAVLPPDLQHTFNYIPSSAQLAAARRRGDEQSSDQDWNREKQQRAILTIGDTSSTYMVSQYEYDRLLPYRTKLEKLRTQVVGYASNVDTSAQKLEANRAALNHSDPQAVENFNAELAQFNDYKEWTDGQINDFNSQVVNYDNEVKMQGRPKP